MLLRHERSLQLGLVGAGIIFPVAGVCTEDLIRVDDVMESPKLAE